MNLALGLFGLRSEARRRTSYLFVLGLLVFMGVVTFSAINAWHLVNTTMFQWLNGCSDTNSSLAWLREQPYQPSPEYTSCVNDVHQVATVEAFLAVGVMICAAVAFIVWMIEEFVNEYAVPADDSQARTYHFGALYVGCLVVAVLLLLAGRAVLDPYAS